jgi:hypothetical protein
MRCGSGGRRGRRRAGPEVMTTGPATRHDRVARTHAATAANRRRAAARAAAELAGRLEYLDDQLLATLAAVLVAEASDRRLAVPHLDEGAAPNAPARSALWPLFSDAP